MRTKLTLLHLPQFIVVDGFGLIIKLIRTICMVGAAPTTRIKDHLAADLTVSSLTLGLVGISMVQPRHTRSDGHVDCVLIIKHCFRGPFNTSFRGALGTKLRIK